MWNLYGSCVSPGSLSVGMDLMIHVFACHAAPWGGRSLKGSRELQAVDR